MSIARTHPSCCLSCQAGLFALILVFILMIDNRVTCFQAQFHTLYDTLTMSWMVFQWEVEQHWYDSSYTQLVDQKNKWATIQCKHRLVKSSSMWDAILYCVTQRLWNHFSHTLDHKLGVVFQSRRGIINAPTYNWLTSRLSDTVQTLLCQEGFHVWHCTVLCNPASLELLHGIPWTAKWLVFQPDVV